MKTLYKSYIILIFLFLWTGIAFTSDENLVVTQVVDGDTIELSNGEKIRLIGVDAYEIYNTEKVNFESRNYNIPSEETIQMGIKARDFLKDLVQGKEIELEYDIINAPESHKDKYGRTLAYVNVFCKNPPEILKQFSSLSGAKKWKKKTVNVNAVLIQCGMARANTFYHYKNKDEFIGFEKNAKDLKLEIWAKEKKDENIKSTSNSYCIAIIKKSDTYHKTTCAEIEETPLKYLNIYNTINTPELSGKIPCSICFSDNQLNLKEGSQDEMPKM